MYAHVVLLIFYQHLQFKIPCAYTCTVYMYLCMCMCKQVVTCKSFISLITCAGMK